MFFSVINYIIINAIEFGRGVDYFMKKTFSPKVLINFYLFL